MKPRPSNQKTQAFTLLEAVVILFVLLLLGAMLFPRFDAGPSRAPRIACVNNLKQIGLAYHIWAGDNIDKFPMDVSVTNGGATELAATGNVLAVFLTMTNELLTPKILHCPADRERTLARQFDSTFSGSNISYFIGIDASENYPQMILSGDDHLQIDNVPVRSSLLNLPTNTLIAWTHKRHYGAGNIGLADGSAQQLTSLGLQQALQQTGTNLTRLAIP